MIHTITVDRLGDDSVGAFQIRVELSITDGGWVAGWAGRTTWRGS